MGSVRGWIDRQNSPAFGILLDGVRLSRSHLLVTKASDVDVLADLLPRRFCDWLREAITERVISGVYLHQHLPSVAAVNIELEGVPADGSEAYVVAINSMCRAAGLPTDATATTPYSELRDRIVSAYTSFQADQS